MKEKMDTDLGRVTWAVQLRYLTDELQMNLHPFRGKSMMWDFDDFSSPIQEVCGQAADMYKMWEKFG